MLKMADLLLCIKTQQNIKAIHRPGSVSPREKRLFQELEGTSVPCVSVRTSTDTPVGVGAPPWAGPQGMADGGRGGVHKETARADHSGFKTLTSVWNEAGI